MNRENIKGRECSIPEKEIWEQFFDPGKILRIMQVDEAVKNVAELGYGYGTFTIPAAKRIERFASGRSAALPFPG